MAAYLFETFRGIETAQARLDAEAFVDALTPGFVVEVVDGG
jgi:hypothetical protein